MRDHISVVITTQDQAHQVSASIGAIVDQDFEEAYEVIIIDDGSTDGTADTVRRLFGTRVRVVEKDAADGWLRSMAMAVDEAKGTILAVCDPHCVVKPNWLDVILKQFRSDSALSIMTGPAFHGFGLVQKLAALTSHAQFISSKRRHIDHIFDDNFAIRKEVLSALLADLPVQRNVNDAVGCALLSSQAKQQGMAVLYEPDMAAFHVSPTFREYLREWKHMNARTTMEIRLLDPGSRGASLSRHLPLIPFVYPLGRILFDVRNAWRFRKELGLSHVDFPLLFIADVVGKAWYSSGLVSCVKHFNKVGLGEGPNDIRPKG